MNTSKIVALGQNLNNSSTATKIIKNAQNSFTIDELSNGYKLTQTTFQLPNGKTVSNMLDAFIVATGTNIENYNPTKVVDFMA